MCADMISINLNMLLIRHGEKSERELHLPSEPNLEFCPYLLPEFIFTGHEVLKCGQVELPEEHGKYFDLVVENPDIFPGVFHSDMEANVLPKRELLREFGFYPFPEDREPDETSTDSCGAHSSRITPHEPATRA